MAPSPFRLVLVATPPTVREARLTADGLVGADARARLDAHSTEREVDDRLPALAGLSVEGTGDPDAAADAVVTAMRVWGWRP